MMADACTAVWHEESELVLEHQLDKDEWTWQGDGTGDITPGGT